tara:strand:- start:29763 stop:31103 length:1341 start_codon:yes stop_codon:yes gene_type:complete
VLTNLFSQSKESAVDIEVLDGTLNKVRQLVHQRLIDSVEIEGAGVLSDAESISEQIQWLLTEFSEKNGLDFNSEEKKKIENEIILELDGMGPLASLMMDSSVSDILVNGPHDIWVDRRGELSKTDVRFDDHSHLRRFLDRILAMQGKALDSSNPMVDAKLPDGSRLHAVISPLCSLGAVVSIRRFQKHSQNVEELLQQGFVSKGVFGLLKLAVQAGLNIVVAGGASAGKTSLLNQLSAFIPDNERVVTIEETAELRLRNAHCIPLETRTANTEGRGEVSLRELLRTALRMRADRIIVGEVRGAEVFDMLQAMNIGHDGSMTTVHANSPHDVISRLETLALMEMNSFSRQSIRGMIGSAIHLIVQLTRYSDGTRAISSVCLLSVEEGELNTATLYTGTRAPGSGCDQRKMHYAVQLKLLNTLSERGYETEKLRVELEKEALGEIACH